jgi:hypothetical protein
METKGKNVFKIVTGAMAILAVICNGILLSKNMEIHAEYVEYDAYSSSFEARIEALTYYILPHVVTIIAMIVLALYIFMYHGKKWSPLLGLSALLIAAQKILFSIGDIYWIKIFPDMADAYYDYSIEIKEFYIFLIADILIALVFLLIALTYFEKLKVGQIVIKVLPIIAMVVFFIPKLILVFGEAIYFVADISYIIVYILFAFLCSPPNKRIKAIAQKPHLPQQEMITTGMSTDLNSQLLFLKNEYENGSITEQEYEQKKKSLIDKL